MVIWTHLGYLSCLPLTQHHSRELYYILYIPKPMDTFPDHQWNHLQRNFFIPYWIVHDQVMCNWKWVKVALQFLQYSHPTLLSHNNIYALYQSRCHKRAIHPLVCHAESADDGKNLDWLKLSALQCQWAFMFTLIRSMRASQQHLPTKVRCYCQMQS